MGRIGLGIAQALPWLLVILLTGANLLYISRLGPNDDAYITYRVARNLAAGHGPVYNVGEPVLSITTPGYMLLLTAGSVFTDDFVVQALALNGLALLVIGGLLIDLSRCATFSQPTNGARSTATGLASRGRQPSGQMSTYAGSEQGMAQPRENDRSGYRIPYVDTSWLAATVAVALTLTYPLLSESLGMETPLYVAALLATFAAYKRAWRRNPRPSLDAPRHETQEKWLLWTAAGAAAAFLLRPDGLLVGLAVGVHWVATQRRIPWRAVLVGTALVLPWIAFAWIYYGSPVPNTLVAKTTQGLASQVPRWGPQFLNVARDWLTANPIAAGLALIGLAMSARDLARGRSSPTRLAMLLWSVLYVLAHVLLDVRSYFWYYAPLAPVVALLAGDGTVAISHALATTRSRSNLASAAKPSGPQQTRTPWSRGWLQALAVAVMLVLALYASVQAAGNLTQPPEPRRREQAYQQTGQALQSTCAEEKTAATTATEDLSRDGQRFPGLEVGLAEIGLIGYMIDCPVIDFAGLLQPDIAHLQAGPAEKMIFGVKRYWPELVVLAGGTGYPRDLANASWFRQRYEPVDIYDEGGFRSVIYQRGLGPSRQRDLAAGWWNQESAAPVTTTLTFPITSSRAITLHAFLPAASALQVTAPELGSPEIAGAGNGWADYALALGAIGDAADRNTSSLMRQSDITVEIRGRAADQPASVAWIESGALPTVYYFVPLQDASLRPRPTVRLDPGQSQKVWLGLDDNRGAELRLMHRDRPGVRLAVLVNGQLLETVGGADDWRQETIPLPGGLGPAVEVELRNDGSHLARLASIALVSLQRDGAGDANANEAVGEANDAIER